MSDQPNKKELIKKQNASRCTLLSLVCILTCFLPCVKFSFLGYSKSLSYMDASTHGTLVLILSIVALFLLFIDFIALGCGAAGGAWICIFIDLVIETGFEHFAFGGYVYIVGSIIAMLYKGNNKAPTGGNTSQ